MQFLYEDKDLSIFKIKQIVIFITICLLYSCETESSRLTKVSAKQVAIDSSLFKNNEIDSFIQPYYNRINTILDSTLAYAPKMLSKDDGRYNT